MRLSIWIAIMLAAFSTDINAETSIVSLHPAACEGTNPRNFNKIRLNQTGLNNISSTRFWVTCPLALDIYENGTDYIVGGVLGNSTSLDVSMTCSLKALNSDGNFQRSRRVTVPANDVADFSWALFGEELYNPLINCRLEPGTTLGAIIYASTPN